MVTESQVYRIVAAVGIFMIAFSSSALSVVKVTSEPVPMKIVIDGLSTDWEGIDLRYLEDSVRILGITHDSENLYLMWRFGDERLAQQILARGVTIWVNGDGKKRETLGVRYSGSVALAQILPPPQGGLPGGRGDADRRPGVGGISALREPGVVTYLEGETETDFEEGRPQGLSAASSRNQGTFCYEVRIPLALIGGKVVEIPATKARTLTIGLQIGGLSPAERQDIQISKGEMSGGGMNGGMSGPGGGMGGMSRGGGMKGGHGRSKGNQMRLPEVAWLKIRLEPTVATASEFVE